MFLLFRGIVGIGEASYSNVCPSMISDMFTGPTSKSHVHDLLLRCTRWKVRLCFTGLGFVVGSNVASLLNAWQWGVRVTAVAGIGALALLVLVVDEPKRGGAEITAGAHLQGEVATSYWTDIKSLATTPTFITCTWAYTALIFVTGTLTWWEPTIIAHSIAWTQGLNDTRLLPSSKKDQVGLIFGLITTVSGLIGVSIGTLLSGLIRSGRGVFRAVKTERAQPIISGIGALLAAPLLLLIFLFGHKSIIMLWVSDAIRGPVKTPETQYLSLIKACAVTVVLLCVSAALYFACAAVLIRDQYKFKEEMGLLTSSLKKPASSNSSIERLNTFADDDDVETADQRL
ncbi:spinster domain protein [Cooperia oncophora]